MDRSNWTQEICEEEMMKYVNNKYNKKFKILDRVFSTNVFNIVDERNVLYLYDEDPKYNFIVYEYIENLGEYYDDYRTSIFSKQLDNKYENAVRQLFGDAYYKIHLKGDLEMCDDMSKSLENCIIEKMIGAISIVIATEESYDEVYLQKIRKLFDELIVLETKITFISMGFVDNISDVKLKIDLSQYTMAHWTRIENTSGYIYMNSVDQIIQYVAKEDEQYDAES